MNDINDFVNAPARERERVEAHKYFLVRCETLESAVRNEMYEAMPSPDLQMPDPVEHEKGDPVDRLVSMYPRNIQVHPVFQSFINQISGGKK